MDFRSALQSRPSRGVRELEGPDREAFEPMLIAELEGVSVLDCIMQRRSAIQEQAELRNDILVAKTNSQDLVLSVPDSIKQKQKLSDLEVRSENIGNWLTESEQTLHRLMAGYWGMEMGELQTAIDRKVVTMTASAQEKADVCITDDVKKCKALTKTLEAQGIEVKNMRDILQKRLRSENKKGPAVKVNLDGTQKRLRSSSNYAKNSKKSVRANNSNVFNNRIAEESSPVQRVQDPVFANFKKVDFLKKINKPAA